MELQRREPPVHAWATFFLSQIERDLGRGDIKFLERSFQGLLLNFNWWVNRKDPAGRNVFAGGFLGLDNIGVFDRSAPLPTGGSLEQADGTAWMAFYCQNMLEIALILAEQDPVYEEHAYRFLQHFIWISYAMDRLGEHHDEMWDEDDGFFYDLLRLPDGSAMRLKVRSMVGLLPLCAATVFDRRPPRALSEAARADRALQEPPSRGRRARGADGGGFRRVRRAPPPLSPEQEEARARPRVPPRRERVPRTARHPVALARTTRTIRSSSTSRAAGTTSRTCRRSRTRGCSEATRTGAGPVWMPVNGLIIRALMNLYPFYGDDFKVECPTGSGNRMTLFEIAKEISRRLAATFLRDASGRRPVYGGTEKFQTDPYWRDHILFYEYFHGDNGAGLGASHQTGWTGLVARLLDTLRAPRRRDPPQGGEGATSVPHGARAGGIESGWESKPEKRKSRCRGGSACPAARACERRSLVKPTRIVILIALAVALCLAGAAVAQTVVDTKVKSGLVIGKTSHSVVLKMDDGVVRELEVPPGRTAMVDGKEVGLADLKLGTTLSATFHTIAKPVEVKTVTIKNGEVVKVAGANLTTKEKDGFHNYLVPAGFKFLVDGRETGIESITTRDEAQRDDRHDVEGDDDGDAARGRRDRQGAGRARSRPGRRAGCRPAGATADGGRCPREAGTREGRGARAGADPRDRGARPGDDGGCRARDADAGSGTRAAPCLLAHDDDRHRPHRAGAPRGPRLSRNQEESLGARRRVQVQAEQGASGAHRVSFARRGAVASRVDGSERCGAGLPTVLTPVASRGV